MYEFTDTTEQATDTNLGAESLKINGKYIEDLIPGYLTLYTSGRELLECEIATQVIGNKDGADYRGKRYPARTITVGYQLCTSSEKEFREAYNKLNRVLNVEQAQLIFADELDKYFVGTKVGNTAVSTGTNCVTGEIDFYCADPFKYSLEEKVFTTIKNTTTGALETTVVNDGVLPAAISYEIIHNHENGYIGIVSEYGALQYGNPGEVDQEIRNKSETLLNLSGGDKIIKQIAKGTGVLTDSAFQRTGNFTWQDYHDGKNQVFYPMLAANYGSGNNWHGPCGQITLPAKRDGDTGSVSFKATAKIMWELQYASEIGCLQFNIGDTDGKLLASMNLCRKSGGNLTTNLKLITGNSVKGNLNFNRGQANEYHKNNGGGYMYIQKTGELFEFYFAGNKYQYRISELAAKKAASITMWLGYPPNNTYSLDHAIHYAGFIDLSFRTDSVTYLHDIPNRYKDGEVLTVDGPSAKMYINGIPSLNDEAVGSKYFKAPPGETKVEFYYSDFSDPAPTITAKIREAYL